VIHRSRTIASTVSLLALGFGCNRTPPEPVTMGAANAAPEPAQVAAHADASRGSSSRGSSGNSNTATAPTVEVPPGPPPTTLQTQDIVVGTGPEAHAGQHVDVQYTGVAWSTHRQFDSSWSRGGQPFSFTLGTHQVIPGWDQGVAGMHVGGRRRLIIPPDLGYGARGAGRDIGPNETLVFVVDLVAVH
jgi:peptidylprolyl isomerase